MGVAFDMMLDSIQADIRHDILWVGCGSGHTPRTCGRIAHDRQTHGQPPSFTVMLARPISDVVPCR